MSTGRWWGLWLTGVAACGPKETSGPCERGLQAVTPTGTGQNVVVVLFDDLGIDRFATYGEHPTPAHTPVLDGLRAQSLQFQSAYVNPTCSPTRATLLTGRRPRRTGIGQWILANNGRDRGLLDEEVTIPELLQDSPVGPWSSAVTGKWHLNTFAEDAAGAAQRQGFDHHLGTLGNPTESQLKIEGDRGYFHWERNVDGELAQEDRYLTTVTTDDALDQLRTLPEPFFLYVPYNAGHSPWHLPPQELVSTPLPSNPTDEQELDAMIEALDTEFGRLLAEIDLTTTLLVVSADNGGKRLLAQDPWGRRGYKGTVDETGVRVPMWVAGAGVEAAGEETPALVYAADLFATVADVAGIGVDTFPEAIDGVSWLPLLSDPHRSWRRCLVTEQFPQNGEPTSDLERGLRDHQYVFLEEEDRFEDRDASRAGAPTAVEPRPGTMGLFRAWLRADDDWVKPADRR